MAAGVRFLRWVVLPMLGLPAVMFLGSNLVMQSRWATDWAEGKLEGRTKLDWEVGSMSWTPWSGVQLGKLRAALPEEAGVEAPPVCEIGGIRIIPEWGQLLRGERGWREIVVGDPKLVLPVELVAAMGAPAGRVEPPPAKPPAKKKEPGEKPLPKEPEESPGKEPSPEKPAEEKPPAPERPAKKPPAKKPDGKPPAAAKKPPVPEKTEAEEPPPGPRRVIRFERARVALYSLKNADFRVELRGVSGELPVSGEDAEGWVAASGLWLNDRQLAGEWKEKIEWKRPVLVLPDGKREWNGLATRMRGTMQPGGAMRTNIDLQVLPGPLGPLSHPDFPGIVVSAGKVGGGLRFTGDLRRPSGWRAEVVGEAADVAMTRRTIRQPFRFDDGAIAASYRGGVLRVPKAWLRSEPISLLGNGLVVTDGRTYGVLRIVANREIAESFTKVAVGAFLTGGWTRQWLTPLGTPDRYYRDIHLRGRPGKLLVDVGRRHESLDAGLAWNRLVSFYNREAAEDERGEPRSAPREMFRPAP